MNRRQAPDYDGLAERSQRGTDDCHRAKFVEDDVLGYDVEDAEDYLGYYHTADSSRLRLEIGWNGYKRTIVVL